MNVSSTPSLLALQLQGGLQPEPPRARAPEAAPVQPPLPPRDAIPAGEGGAPRAEAAQAQRGAQGVSVPETADAERVQSAFAREAPLNGSRPGVVPPGSRLDIRV